MAIELDGLSVEELTGLRDRIDKELTRRNAAAYIEEQVTHVYESARGEGMITAPEAGVEWVQPAGAHDAYVAGDVVEYAGRVWVSIVTPNVWEPGVTGWRQQDTNGAGDGDAANPAPYQQPAGAHDAYNTGDLVTWNNKTYRAKQDAVVWSPGDWPAAWELIE